MKIVILDIGLSNVGSVKNIINSVNSDVSCEIVTTPHNIEGSNLLILPGVGNFFEASQKINALGLRDIIVKNSTRNDFRVLGICLGMQLLGNSSEEGKGLGLGLIDGNSESLKNISNDITVPNMGWCDVEGFAIENETPRFYHVHSYHFKPKLSTDIWLTTQLGGEKIVVGIKRGRISGVQFHPEKSHRFGKIFFERYLNNAIQKSYTDCTN